MGYHRLAMMETLNAVQRIIAKYGIAFPCFESLTIHRGGAWLDLVVSDVEDLPSFHVLVAMLTELYELDPFDEDRKTDSVPLQIRLLVRDPNDSMTLLRCTALENVFIAATDKSVGVSEDGVQDASVSPKTLHAVAWTIVSGFLEKSL